MGIAFWPPGNVKTSTILTVTASNYSFKLLVAPGVTPLRYAGHTMTERFLGLEEATGLWKEAAGANEVVRL